MCVYFLQGKYPLTQIKENFVCKINLIVYLKQKNKVCHQPSQQQLINTAIQSKTIINLINESAAYNHNPHAHTSSNTASQEPAKSNLRKFTLTSNSAPSTSSLATTSSSSSSSNSNSNSSSSSSDLNFPSSSSQPTSSTSTATSALNTSQNEPIKRKSRKQEFKKQIDEPLITLNNINESNNSKLQQQQQQRYLNENLNINNNDAASSTSSSSSSPLVSLKSGKHAHSSTHAGPVVPPQQAVSGTGKKSQSSKSKVAHSTNFNLNANVKYGDYFNDSDPQKRQQQQQQSQTQNHQRLDATHSLFHESSPITVSSANLTATGEENRLGYLRPLLFFVLFWSSIGNLSN